MINEIEYNQLNISDYKKENSLEWPSYTLIYDKFPQSNEYIYFKKVFQIIECL